MYVPNRYDWLFPAAEILAGVFVHKRIEPTWEATAFVQVPFAVVAVIHAAALYRAEARTDDYYKRVDAQQAARNVAFNEQAKEVREGNKPKINLMGQVYSKTVQPVKFDKERQVANILLHQRKHNFEIKFTEAYWIEGNPRRFTGSRDELVALWDKWQGWGIIARKNPARKNSSYHVVDWRGMELVAAGEELPTPPPRL